MLLFLSKSLRVPLPLPVPTALLVETKFVRSFVVEIIRSGSDKTNFWLSKLLWSEPRVRPGGEPVDQTGRAAAPVTPPAGRQNLSNKGKQNKPFFKGSGLDQGLADFAALKNIC